MRLYFALAMICLGINAANAAKVDCSIGGQYQGSYGGPDSGIASVHVDANTGIVAGSATSSQNGQSIAIAGVLDSTGEMTNGGVTDSGALFSGQFSPDGTAAGEWAKRVSTPNGPRTAGGTWRAARTAVQRDCS